MYFCLKALPFSYSALLENPLSQALYTPNAQGGLGQYRDGSLILTYPGVWGRLNDLSKTAPGLWGEAPARAHCPPQPHL